MLEVKSRKLEAGSRKLEVGSWKLEVGSWKSEVESPKFSENYTKNLPLGLGLSFLMPDAQPSLAYFTVRVSLKL